VLQLLGSEPSPQLEAVLGQTSVTVIGGGDVQLDWEVGDHYFEVEIPSEGSLPYCFEKGLEEREASSPSPAEFVDVFRAFWAS
jgi:hypothetical protein